MNQPVSTHECDKTYNKIFVKDNCFHLSFSVSWQYQTVRQIFLIYITMMCFFYHICIPQFIPFHKNFTCTLVSQQYTVNMNTDRNVLPIVIKTRCDYTPISSWQKITLNMIRLIEYPSFGAIMSIGFTYNCEKVAVPQGIHQTIWHCRGLNYDALWLIYPCHCNRCRLLPQENIFDRLSHFFK